MNIGTGDLKRRLKSLFSDNSTGRAVTHLISGNLISQIVIFAALPAITRIYSPENMSLLAIYVAILTMISVVVCLRLELAIPVPESDTVAVNLATLAFLSTMAVSVVIAAFLCIIWIVDVRYITGHPLWNYAWFIPFGSVSVGLYATAQYWSTRVARYSLLGRTRIYQALVGATTQIITGLMNIVPFGLLLGHLLMSSAGFLSLFRMAWRYERPLLTEITSARIRDAFVTYKNFPKFSIVEGLANNGAQQITIILLSVFIAGPEAGFFFVAMRALSAPIALITNAISQVYYQKAPEHMRRGTLQGFTRKILGVIAIIFVPPLLVFSFFVKPVFIFVFGADWARAGEMVIILMPMLILSLFSASIGMVMNVTGQQKLMMHLKLSGFALRVGSVVFAALYFQSRVIEIYAFSSFIYYAICIVFFYNASVQDKGASTLGVRK